MARREIVTRFWRIGDGEDLKLYRTIRQAWAAKTGHSPKATWAYNRIKSTVNPEEHDWYRNVFREVTATRWAHLTRSGQALRAMFEAKLYASAMRAYFRLKERQVDLVLVYEIQRKSRGVNLEKQHG